MGGDPFDSLEGLRRRLANFNYHQLSSDLI
jgi:hypothetical protein